MLQTQEHWPVLPRAGFEMAGRHEFGVEHHWSIPELAGHTRSTSFLSPSVLAEHASEVDAAHEHFRSRAGPTV